MKLLLYIKEFWLRIFATVFIVLAPVYWIIILIGAFVIADTIAGRWAMKHEAIKKGLHPRELIKSQVTREGFLSKSASYMSIFFFAFILDHFFFNDLSTYFFEDFPINYTISIIIGIAICSFEFDSIDEKYYRVYGIGIVSKLKNRAKALKKFLTGAKSYKNDIDELLKK